MRRQILPSIISMVIFTLVLGLAYPLLVTGIAQVVFKDKAEGSLVSKNGKVVGSSQIAQAFLDKDGNPLPEYFQPRPSAIGYDPTYSSGSNYGPLNPRLIANCSKIEETDANGKTVVGTDGTPNMICDPNTTPQRAKAYRNSTSSATTSRSPSTPSRRRAPGSTPTSPSPTRASKPRASPTSGG